MAVGDEKQIRQKFVAGSANFDQGFKFGLARAVPVIKVEENCLQLAALCIIFFGRADGSMNASLLAVTWLPTQKIVSAQFDGANDTIQNCARANFRTRPVPGIQYPHGFAGNILLVILLFERERFGIAERIEREATFLPVNGLKAIERGAENLWRNGLDYLKSINWRYGAMIVL
jgi:hypothetical protein